MSNEQKNVGQRRAFLGDPAAAGNLNGELDHLHKRINEIAFLKETLVNTNYTATIYDRALSLTRKGTTVTLPFLRSESNGILLLVKDKSGLAATTNHTIKTPPGSGGLIDGSSTLSITTNYGFVWLWGSNESQDWFQV